MLEVVSLFIFMCIIYIMIGKLIWESDCKCFFFEDEERKTNVFIEKKDFKILYDYDDYESLSTDDKQTSIELIYLAD